MSAVGGRPERRRAAVLEQQDPVAVLGGEREVVQHRDHRAPLGGELAHEVEEPDLVAQVEEARRLVEGERRRLLRERARHHHALALAGGELVDRPFGERRGVDPRERRPGDRDVARPTRRRRPPDADGGRAAPPRAR